MEAKLKELINNLKKDYQKVRTTAERKYDEIMRKVRKTRSKKKGSSSSRRLKKDIKARNKAEALAKLPKSRIKRFWYYVHPVRAAKFWFSKKGLILALKIFGVAMAVFIFLAISLFAYFRRDIDADPANLKASLLAQTTKFYDQTGEKLLYTVHGDQNRTWVDFEDISGRAIQATVAVEDKDFYNHNGFSIEGTLGAVFRNIFGDKEYTSGGSTITQQFVKNAFLTTEKTYTRKIKELILALEMERLYSKDEILEFYMNQIPYGSTEYGIEAAAQSFFNKPASELTIAESALLAALPQAPSALSPYNDDTTDLINRQHTIIDLMLEQGYITEEKAQKAKDKDILANITPLEDKNQFKNIVAPHYVVEVQKILEGMFGEDLVASGGLKVITSLDYNAQKLANRAVREHMDTVIQPVPGVSAWGGDNAALVAIDIENGNVIAMVGSRNYNYKGYGAYNAAMANRQPGSSFKPYVYAQLFYNERWSPDSYIYDTRASFNGYTPQNFDSGFRGRETVRQALGESRNIPAVKAMHIAGVDNVLNLARNMGNESLGQNGVYLGLSAALGAGEVTLLEHTTGFSTFARDGDFMPPNFILKVENSAGEVLYEWEEPEPENVLDPQIAYLITDILSDDAARQGVFGWRPPNMTVNGLTHTVKTGTTNEAVDGWMMGYTNYYSVGVWVGNHDNAPMNYTGTSRQTGPIWTQFMRELHKNLKDVPIHESNHGVKRVTFDSYTGYLADDNTKNTRTGIAPSWFNPEDPPEGASYTKDIISGGLATDCTPDAAKKFVQGQVFWPEVLPSDVFFRNWAKGAESTKYPYGNTVADVSDLEPDDVHSCSDIFPTASITSVTQDPGTNEWLINVGITEGTHDLDNLIVRVDGQIIENRKVNNTGNEVIVYTFDEAGDYEIRVNLTDELLYNDVDEYTLTVDAGDVVVVSEPGIGGGWGRWKPRTQN